jgi:outer membrane lipoprotein-sorting protein
MRKVLFALALLVFTSAGASAQTADEIIAKYVKTIGGMEKIQAVKTLRRTGKIIAGGGFEIPVVEENKRPNWVRQDLTIQGLVGTNAYDGKVGWKIAPWQGKKDAETMGEGELKSIIEEADFDGPLVNYKEKGNKVEFVGMDEVEGTDTYKLKVTLAGGETRFYYMDTDYYVPIKVETKRIIRGNEVEIETVLGDYKEVAGWYIPWSLEIGAKGSQFKQKIAIDKAEANVTIDDGRFAMPKKP